MTTPQLEEEARKWNVEEYFDGHVVSRQLIIDALLKKDQMNVAQLSIIISFIALIASIVSLSLN